MPKPILMMRVPRPVYEILRHAAQSSDKTIAEVARNCIERDLERRGYWPPAAPEAADPGGER